MARSRTVTWSATVLAPALPGRSTPARVSPVASAKQNIGWKPKPPLKVGAAPSLFSECTSTNEASMSKTTGAFPAAAWERRHTSARTLARAPAMLARVDAVIRWKVRASVVSEGTGPNRSSPIRRCSMSRQLSPLPASIRAAWARTLPRSWNATPRPRQGITDERTSPNPKRSANRPRACSPTWATTPVPPGSTTTRRVLLAFTLEMPFWSGLLVIRHQQLPLLGGQFRRRGPVSSIGGVKSLGSLPDAPSRNTRRATAGCWPRCVQPIGISPDASVVEHVCQSRSFEDPARGALGPTDLEALPRLLDSPSRSEERGEPARVDELEMGEVGDDPGLGDRDERVLHCVGADEVELAEEPEHGRAVVPVVHLHAERLWEHALTDRRRAAVLRSCWVPFPLVLDPRSGPAPRAPARSAARLGVFWDLLPPLAPPAAADEDAQLGVPAVRKVVVGLEVVAAVVAARLP